MKLFINLIFCGFLGMLSNSHYSFSQTIITDLGDMPILPKKKYLLLNSMDQNTFDGKIYFQFARTSHENIFRLNRVFNDIDSSGDYYSSALEILNDHTIYFDLASGFLLSDNFIIAYFCGNQAHKIKSAQMDSLENSDHDSHYSKACKNNTDFILDIDSTLIISYSENTIKLIGGRPGLSVSVEELNRQTEEEKIRDQPSVSEAVIGFFQKLILGTPRSTNYNP